jgi:DNA replication and repair protein RecF
VYVSQIALTDFRSYLDLDLDLEPGPSAFVGPNGQGKTNLVEAIGYAATLASHRVTSDAALVRSGAQRAVVRVRAVRADRQTLVELEINPGRANRAQVNRAPVRRSRDVLGILRAVVFAPEDLALVKGDPDGRRLHDRLPRRHAAIDSQRVALREDGQSDVCELQHRHALPGHRVL